MKLFRLIGTMTIVAAVAATMAVSASAATATLNGNAVKVETEATAVETGYTVLVSSALENADPTEEQIYQLYQNAELGDIALPADLPAGKYYVRVGGIEGGYETASFVKALEVAATAEVVDDAAGTVASWYKVVTKAPAGLTPYWTAEGAEDLEALFGDKTANIEGNVMLGLVVEGETAPATVTLIWK